MTRRQPKHRPKLGGMAVSLLNELLNGTVDQGYLKAAERRAAGTPAPHRRRRQAGIAVGLVLVGLLFGVAFRQTRARAPESERAKLALIHDIEQRTRTSDELERRVGDLAAQVARERDAALAASSEGNREVAALRAAERRDGLAPVRGPGVLVTVGDAQPRQQTDPVSGQPLILPPDENGRISDRDLQAVVNGLWAAGGEAISVDGRRLTPTSTIREAGNAILVDFFPVTSPYQVEVIGHPDLLLPRFVDSRVGQQFQTYVGAYQIEFDVRRADVITLSAATGTDLKYAFSLPVPTPTPASGASGTAAPTPTAPTGRPPAVSTPGMPSPGGTR
ncbi:MAG TPA: DUF881 domain-containing protein [Mycobacteriales bacterium]|nr:DUF881 domain-containing protein [Mycobacteriales bacterium]